MVSLLYYKVTAPFFSSHLSYYLLEYAINVNLSVFFTINGILCSYLASCQAGLARLLSLYVADLPTQEENQVKRMYIVHTLYNENYMCTTNSDMLRKGFLYVRKLPVVANCA